MLGQWLDCLSPHKKAAQLVAETDEKASCTNWDIYAKLRGKVKANSVPCASLMGNCFWKLLHQRECMRARPLRDVKWIRMSVHILYRPLGFFLLLSFPCPFICTFIYFFFLQWCSSMDDFVCMAFDVCIWLRQAFNRGFTCSIYSFLTSGIIILI